MSTTSKIHKLRDETGKGLLSCKAALEACNEDVDRAKQYLLSAFGQQRKG